jgi:hypothetical protein
LLLLLLLLFSCDSFLLIGANGDFSKKYVFLCNL